jgi:hypothetical protein
VVVVLVAAALRNERPGRGVSAVSGRPGVGLHLEDLDEVAGRRATLVLVARGGRPSTAAVAVLSLDTGGGHRRFR